MTSDTPTTATAAMRELLTKHPTPWKVFCDEWEKIADANGRLVDLDDIVAAVNATGTGDKLRASAGAVFPNISDDEKDALTDDYLVVLNAMTTEELYDKASIAWQFARLRCALAAAREQQGAMMATLDEVRKHDAEAYRYFMANDNVGGIFSYGLLHSALAALPTATIPHGGLTNAAREALEFYADPRNWNESAPASGKLDGVIYAMQDKGARARSALSPSVQPTPDAGESVQEKYWNATGAVLSLRRKIHAMKLEFANQPEVVAALDTVLGLRAAGGGGER